MYTNVETAVREMCALFTSAWVDNSEPLPASYPGSKFDLSSITASSVWARWKIQHTGRAQASLADVAGKRRWLSTGIITVETYTPAGKGHITPYQVAQKVVNAYEGKRTPGEAWFRNVRLIETDIVNELWERVDIFIDFEYDIIS